jgi:PAS domain S-box-containing protein
MHAVLPVLYAEDNPLDAALTRAHFARSAPEFALEIVRRAEDFLPLARLRRHAALLIDQKLPDIDGLEVLKLLAHEGIDTPVVLVTGAGDGELASQALRLGAEDYVPKRPGYLEVLPQHLRAVIERHRQRPLPSRSRSRPRRILLVEADAGRAAALAEGLSSCAAHLTLETVETPATALDRLCAGDDYDLVVGAHRPPLEDEFKLIQQARDRGIRTPFILLGENASEESVVTAFRLGASDYVVAPDRRYAELALRIDLAIDRRELSRANARSAYELAERQRVFAALRESEKRLKLALEAGRIGLWSWEVSTGRTEFSARWKAQIGYADDEITNDVSEWACRCHPDDLVRFDAMRERYLAKPWPDYSIEYRLKHRDGAWRWFLLHAALEHDEAGRPLRMLGSQIDITALKQQQTDLAATSTRLQQLSRRLLEVQESERRHLARELHDEIGQVLTVAKIQLQSTVLLPEATAVASRLKETVQLLDRLLAQVRSLSLDLRPPLLDDLGLAPALHWLVQQHQAHAAPRVHLSTDPRLARCEPMLETACFRIAQEALTNALRHAQAESVHVSVDHEDGRLRLRVRDDGIGFDAASARNRAERGRSLGLLGMHERALRAGGTLTLLSAPGRGTEVEAVFQLSGRAAGR